MPIVWPVRVRGGGAVRILVTGGAGFIGTHLVRRLVDAGHEVAVLDDCSTGFAANLAGLDVVLHRASILDPRALDAAVTGVDAVVHLAAQVSVAASVADPVGTHATNATGTVAVLDAARRLGVGHVVVASSSAVYGDDPVLPKHEDLPPAPASPYAASKLAAEAAALAWGASFGLRVLALRFFNVFGPLQGVAHGYAAVVPAFVDAALAGRPLPVHGDGGQTRDFVYVGDVAEVLADAVTRGVHHGGPVNLAFGTRHTVLELVAAIQDAVGHPVTLEHLATRPGDVRHSQADQTRFRALFPTVTPTPLADGLTATVAWFRDAASA